MLVFSENDVEQTPTLAKNFDFIWAFSYCYLKMS